MLAVGFCEGPRRAELRNLTWEQFILEHTAMTFRNTKSDANITRDRHVTDIRPRSIDALREYQAITGASSGPVFLRDDGKPFASAGAFGRYINPHLKEFAGELGLDDSEMMTLHVVRHSSASWHYAESRDIEKVRKRVDWKDFKTASRYIHDMVGVTPEQVRAFWQLTKT